MPSYQELFSVFSNRSYDSLDPRDESFIKDYENFKTRTFELDRKLGAVLVSWLLIIFLSFSIQLGGLKNTHETNLKNGRKENYICNTLGRVVPNLKS